MDVNAKKTLRGETLVPLIEDPFLQIIENLAAVEKTFGDFRSRGQSISDLVYNIINVRQAQAAQRSADAAQEESRSLGRISWITFVFFPLIAVAGIFGMNVDILVNTPPSLAWFFIISAPATVLVFIIALLSNVFFKWRLSVRERKKRDEAHLDKYA
ncbi:hypothetical protein MMC21_007517 [Puttea exsequens]|nr:hypothetical protein [Puttea exsequens]